MTRLILLALLLAGISSAPIRAANAAPCAADPALLVPDDPPTAFQAALASGKPVAILAIGSATTAGGKEAAQALFPAYLMAALHQALPGTAFTLAVRGGRGQTAEDMLPELHRALAGGHIPLVLWQTGTVEAVRGLRPSGMQDALAQGIEEVAAQGGNVVLIDPQFSRFLRANVDLPPYEAVLNEAAAMPGVSLFPRYALMQEWAANREIDLERTPRRARAAALARLNACIGLSLARFVLAGMPAAERLSQGPLPALPR
ncbi:MAG: SGNH/GDSL hydrolase family protein [Rhodospirillales bacterium]|nr:SGNH/GDSL hydrolase family protein [Rhodospirillales bacterium]